MSSETKRIPSSSQTVGPYFTIGLDYLIALMEEVKAGTDTAIQVCGRVLDRDGAPVPDAMLEFWSAGDPSDASAEVQEHAIPDGFRRVATDLEGCFAARIRRPVASRLEDGRLQAPHALVLVFARGLQRPLISRVYLGDRENESDPVLLSIPAERRSTLIAKCDGTDVYHWDVILQGTDETVFFAW